jgi:O-antigen ligase
MRTSSSIAAVPNPTPLLFLLAATAILVWPDAVGVTALIIIASIALPVAVILLGRSPQLAIISLIAASAVPRVSVQIGGLNARPEHVVSGLMILAAAFLWKKRSQPAQWIKADYWVVAYMVFMLFSSAVMSTAPLQTTKWAMQQLLAMLPYFWLRMLVTDWDRFRLAFKIFLIAGAGTLIYAVACFYAYLLFGSTFGVATEQYADMPATYGAQYEGNMLGAYGAAFAIVMLVLYLYKREGKFLAGFAICGLATVGISLSRAALGAVALATLATGVFAARKSLINTKVLLKIAAASLAISLVLAPLILQHFQERFSTVDTSDLAADPNTLTRAVTAVSALDEVSKHPWFGGGVSSFQLAFDWEDLGPEWEDSAWIGNTELRVLHDAGIFGLVAFTGFLISLVLQARKRLKQHFRIELVALLFSGLVYCITFQTTEGTLLSFPWVQLGLIACLVALPPQGEDASELSMQGSTP